MTSFETPHRRFNPLTGEWVLVSAQRTARPWHGSTEDVAADPRPQHDPDCYLCPGSRRAAGAINPDYDSTYVFTNDFPALMPDTVTEERASSPLIRAQGEAGTCRVVCYSPRHDLDLASLDVRDIRSVIDVWSEQTEELAQSYRWVQAFENRGALMGASNPHPHGQIWASSALPGIPASEDRHQRMYHEDTGRLLLLDYLAEEKGSERVVTETDDWMALVPYWAVWPYEMLIVPKRAVRWFPDLESDERDDLSRVLSDVIGRYDRVFDSLFPYSMGWHGAPAPVDEHDHWQLHLHFFPPLLRSASVRKHMVGYELLAEVQRDVTAESAAARLRELATPAS